MTDLLADEHEVPTQLGERIPLFPWLFPLDWTQRQFYIFATGVYFACLQIPDARSLADWMGALAWIGAGLLGVILEYLCKPTPEFWLSAWTEYFSILVVSFPLWWKRLLPHRRGEGGMSWPLATMPRWLGKRLVAPGLVQEDGVVLLPDFRPNRPPKFGVVLGIEPRAHPDLLPMRARSVIGQTRLNIFKHIQGEWSIHLQVRPFDSKKLEIASGSAWPWIKVNMAPFMVVRRPLLVLFGEDRAALVTQAEKVRNQFRQGGMRAWRQSAEATRRLAAELWTDRGLSTQRVRIGLRRVVAGNIGYRSWSLIELPRIVHLAWLRPLTSESLLCDIAIHVKTRLPGPTRRTLQRAIRQWRALEQDQDYYLAVQDAERVLDGMRRGQDLAATIAVYVTARQEQADKVAEALESAQCEFRPAHFMQHRALRATRALGGDPMRRTMKADLRTVAMTDLIATAGYFADGGATLVGEATMAPEPIAINLADDLNNLNWSLFVAIMSGGGKTTLAEMLAWRMANPHKDHPLAKHPIQVVSVDFKPSGDYESLYKNLAAVGHKASYNAWTGGSLPPIEGHVGFNLSDVPEEKHGVLLLELGQRLEEWARLNSEDHSLLLLMDEVIALLEVPGGPSFLRRFGTQGRSLNIMPVFMTQDIGPILDDPKASVAFSNCGHVFVGRQDTSASVKLGERLKLDDTAQALIETAPQGAGLLRIQRKDGPLVLGLQVQPTAWELREFGTNPSERAQRFSREVAMKRAEVLLDNQGTVGAVSVQNRSRKEVHTNGHDPVLDVRDYGDLIGVASVEGLDP